MAIDTTQELKFDPNHAGVKVEISKCLDEPFIVDTGLAQGQYFFGRLSNPKWEEQLYITTADRLVNVGNGASFPRGLKIYSYRPVNTIKITTHIV